VEDGCSNTAVCDLVQNRLYSGSARRISMCSLMRWIKI